MAAERVIPAGADPAEPGARPVAADGGATGDRVYLQAGQIFASAEGESIVTVLGSCVSVCLFDPTATVGGMNHYLLPLPVHLEHSARFGNVALDLLLAEVLRLGARKGRLRAKVFGGAGVLDGFQRSGRSLGQDNVNLALRILEREGIPVVDGDVGGRRGRKVVFRTDDGEAWVRTL